MRRQGARSHQLCGALKELFWTSVHHNSHINLTYIPTTCKPADSPPRTLSLQDAKLSPEAWREVESRLGPHSSDLMALPSNVQKTQSGRALPFVSPYPTPGAAGVNIFAQSPARQPKIFERPYVFPPIVLISQVHKFLHKLSVPYTMCIADVHPRRFWWPQLRAKASEALLLAPKGSEGVVLPPTSDGFSLKWPLPWDLWVFHFSQQVV